jgi:hypothetical protein
MTLCDCGLLSHGQQKPEDRRKASAGMSGEVRPVNYSLKEREVLSTPTARCEDLEVHYENQNNKIN